MLTTEDTKVHKETAEFLVFLRVLFGCIFSVQSRVCCLLFRFAIIKRVPSGSNSVVECDLAKVEVAGSNPVSRSRKSLYFFDHKGARRRFPLISSASLWFIVFGLPSTSPERSANSDQKLPPFGSSSSEGRGTQVVRERSAKPLCVGSIPTRASIASSTYKDHQNTGAIWLPIDHLILNKHFR